MAVEYNQAGKEILDQAVSCNRAVAVNGATYYLGWTGEHSGEQCADAGNTDYGAWTAASKGGSKLTVLRDALPSSTSEIKWNLEAGKVYSTTSRTVYLRHLSSGSVLGQWREHRVSLPLTLPASNQIVHIEPVGEVIELGEYAIHVAGNRPDAQCDLRLYKTSDATGSYITMTMPAGAARHQAWQSIAGGFRVQPGDYLCLWSPSTNFPFDRLTIILRERLILEED